MSDVASRSNIRNVRSVLDLGCGRGFLGRWLQSNAFDARYTGIERVAEAVDAARRNVPDGEIVESNFRSYRPQREVDVVAALDISVNGTIDTDVLDTARAALRNGGTLIATVHSLDGGHAGRIAALSIEVARRFSTHVVEDWTAKVAAFAVSTYLWWLGCDAWHPDIIEKTHLEARTALDAIERGTFHYTIVLAIS